MLVACSPRACSGRELVDEEHWKSRDGARAASDLTWCTYSVRFFFIVLFRQGLIALVFFLAVCRPISGTCLLVLGRLAEEEEEEALRAMD